MPRVMAVVALLFGALPGSVGIANRPPDGKPANTVLKCEPLKGADRGLLKWAVQAHNACGVAANSELFINYCDKCASGLGVEHV